MSLAAPGTAELPLIRYLDLAVLVLAGAAFAIFGFPMLGYAVAAGIWLLQRAIHYAAKRHASDALARGKRNSALGVLGAATLARVWIVALGILLVGLAEREAGLAAAVLCAVLVTVYLASEALARLLAADEGRP